MSEGIKIIEQIETLLNELKKSLGVKSQAGPVISANSQTKKDKSFLVFSGLTKEIHNYVTDGFFKEPKTISEIQNKLRNEGIKKPTTTLMQPLLLLVRKKILSRSKPTEGKGPFKYFQR